jgi:hypothetical protein
MSPLRPVRLTLPRIAFLVLVVIASSSVSVWNASASVAAGVQAAEQLGPHHCNDDTPDGSVSPQDRSHEHSCPCCPHGSCFCLSSGGAILADLLTTCSAAVAGAAPGLERLALSAPPFEEHLRPPIA